MRIDKMVKDKRILPKSEGCFLAVVEYFQDTAARDRDDPDECTFDGLKDARKWLAGFPRDVWDGFSSTEFRYREIDERRRNGNKVGQLEASDFAVGEAACPERGSVRVAGRSLVGSMRGLR